jgi:hypothetical protein
MGYLKREDTTSYSIRPGFVQGMSAWLCSADPGWEMVMSVPTVRVLKANLLIYYNIYIYYTYIVWMCFYGIPPNSGWLQLPFPQMRIYGVNESGASGPTLSNWCTGKRAGERWQLNKSKVCCKTMAIIGPLFLHSTCNVYPLRNTSDVFLYPRISWQKVTLTRPGTSPASSTSTISSALRSEVLCFNYCRSWNQWIDLKESLQ